MIKSIFSKSSKNALASCMIASVVAGCGSFGTKNKGRKANEADSALTGEWRDQCTATDWLGISRQQVVLKFSLVGDFERVTTVFKDERCAEAVSTLEERGTYQSLGKSAVVPSSTDLNFTITAANVTSQNDDATTLLNSVGYCGEKNWQTGRALSILNRECLGRNVINVINGQVVFDIYRFAENDKHLLLGKESIFMDKTNADARPDKINEEHVYFKK